MVEVEIIGIYAGHVSVMLILSKCALLNIWAHYIKLGIIIMTLSALRGKT